MTSTRPKEQRSAANSRYVGRRTSAGIVKITVMVPADRIPELRGITLEWRRNAMIESPSVDGDDEKKGPHPGTAPAAVSIRMQA